jgi:hypothetical protein
MISVPEYNERSGNGLTVWPSTGLSNTDPIATQGLAFFSRHLQTPPPTKVEAEPLTVASPTLGTPDLRQNEPVTAQATLLAEGQLIADAQVLPGTRRALKPAGQILLFKNIMEEWDFTDLEAATLLGFESAADIAQIYAGARAVGHRDANDRLRAILRIATDLDDLFRDVPTIRDWLNEPQHDLDNVTPRFLLTEGPMENLLHVKYYVAYLSGR